MSSDMFITTPIGVFYTYQRGRYCLFLANGFARTSFGE